MRFKFIKVADHHDGQVESAVSVETDSKVLGDLLEEFEHFLRGCGYVFHGKVYISSFFDAGPREDIHLEEGRSYKEEG